MRHHAFRHAVVIGGSIAGLLASRVLSDHFQRVTLIERDRFPDAAIPRKGLPQARHLHILLARGRLSLERMFPGIGAELAAAGADLIDAGRDIAWLTPAGWGARFASDICSFACSRPLLDFTIRRRISRIESVTVLEDTDVAGLKLAADGKRVAAVVLGERRGEGRRGEGDILDADLVVDASGRGSRTPQWLAGLGFTPPAETVIDAHLGYASRIYRRPDNAPTDWKCLYVQAAPPGRTRAGVAFAIEGGRWMVTLGGIGGDYPPTEPDAFADFMRSLATPHLLDAVANAEPLSPIAGYRATENRWRHYERVARWPEGLMVMGDAACAFNPVYGQGMTMAALAALTLHDCLDRQRAQSPGTLDGLAKRFQCELATLNKAPWLLATSEDFRSPVLDGARPGTSMRLLHRYLDRLLAHATRDAAVRRAFLRVVHLLAPPRSLFHPTILAKVLLRPPPKAMAV